jgi:hypothetical protein
MKQGAEWTYEIRGPSTGAGYTVRVVGVASTEIGAIARMRMDLGSTRVEYQCLSTQYGMWRRNRPEDPASPWVQEYEMPADASTTVTIGTRTFRTIGRETVELPAGKFSDVLHIQATEGTRAFDVWFAPDVGMVRRVNKASGVEEVLVRFRAG